MRRIPSAFRWAGMALALALLGGPGVGRCVAAETPATGDAGTPPSLFSPDVEAKLKDFMAKAKDDKAKVWEARMTREIARIAKVTGLSDDGQTGLDAPAKQAVATALVAWQDKVTDAIRKALMRLPPEQQTSPVLDAIMGQVEFKYVQADLMEDLTLPFEQEEWIKALHQTLTPDQLAAWDKEEADRKQAIEKQLDGQLSNEADRIRQIQTSQIISECGWIEREVGLSPDRSTKLENLAKSVVDQAVETWRKRKDKVLLSMEDDQRLQFTKNGNIPILPQEEEFMFEQPAWKDGLAHFLTADEMKRLNDVREARKAQRTHEMGQIMIVLLDEKIAFTSAQRQRLEPIADRLVKNVPELFPREDGDNENNNYSTGVFYSAAGKATDAELAPILDDVQLKRWRHLSDDLNAPKAKPNEAKAQPEENPEPEDMEKAISLFLYQISEQERKRIYDLNVLKAEDVARAASLSAESSARLQAAACGATEESLANWKWFAEQQVRSQLPEVTPQNIQQCLDSFENYTFFQPNFGSSNHESVWDETVKSDLTPQQQEAWKKETDARAAFRDQAIATIVVSDFGRENPISPDQSAKLVPMVANILHDFGPNIAQIFPPSNPVSWFMQGTSSLLPVAGISNDDLKTVLAKDQIDRWHASPEYGNISALWSNIQQMHNQRANMNFRN